MKKSGLIVFAALAVSCLASCNKTKTVWDGNPADTLSGDGSESNPYIISTPAELLKWANLLDSAQSKDISSFAKLTKDVDLEMFSWKPIPYFSGTFDGSGYSIKGLNVNATSAGGFIGTLKDGIVKSLTLNGNVTGEEQSALVAGIATGKCYLQDINTYGSVDVVANYVGGQIGQINNGDVEILNCVNYATINGSNSTGGIVGTNSKSTLKLISCQNNGSITGKNYVGGIVGYLQLANIEGEHSTAKLCTNNGPINGQENVGGITGCTTEPILGCSFSKAGLVTLTKNEETITATTHNSYVSPFIGNLVGRVIYDGTTAFGSITDCSNEDGWANSMIKGGKGCTRLIEYNDKVYLFTSLNNYAISEDNGHTFGSFTNISNASTPSEIMPNGIDKANDTGNTQPYVLPDGRIMIMYRMHRTNDTDGYNYVSLRARISDKNGIFDNSQKPIVFCESATGPSGSPGGLWEPFPLLVERDEQTKKSVIYTYISCDVHSSQDYEFANGYKVKKLDDQIIAPGSSQNTIMVPITIYDDATEVGEGKIEIEDPKIIFRSSEMMRTSTARPGMTILDTLIDGSYCMTMESSEEISTFVDTDGVTKGGYNMVTQISYSKDGLNWTRPQTIIRPKHPTGSTNGNGKSFKCATSGVVTLPDGRLLITCASDEDYSGCWPSDTSHYDQMHAFITDKPIRYGDTFFRNDGLTQLNIYNYCENEYTVWGVCNIVKDRVYVSGQYGVNSINAAGKITSPVDGSWIVAHEVSTL